MKIITQKTKPFLDQKPGTSGLRQKVKVFKQEHYLPNFVQSIFDEVNVHNALLVLGGDGRYFNDEAIQTILKMACANGVSRVMVGQHGILSTPAASHLIRLYHARGGIVLSASHNPGGENGDFGVKYNIGNGGAAPEAVTQAIFERSLKINEYKIADVPDCSLDTVGTYYMGDMTIDVINPVTDYADLMEELFDFKRMREWFANGHTLRFDAMHAVCGPYAKEIFEKRLNAPLGTVIHAMPKKDFDGKHPDPNPIYAKDLVDFMCSKEATDLGAATDGDGDRNMIVGRGFAISPSDSLAILVAQATKIKAYESGLKGVARSMPTSTAVDTVARALNIPSFETPTGWKFFGNLLDSDKITFCGEESYGTSSNHVREKDGIWAILCWLNLLSVTNQSVEELLHAHWKRFGRHYYCRYDYEQVNRDDAQKMMAHLIEQLPQCINRQFGSEKIIVADEFSYTDPVDRSVSSHQGVRFIFASGSRIVFRLSGTGTVGATIRIYFERYEKDQIFLDVQDMIAPLVEIAKKLSKIEVFTKREAPSLIT